MRQVRGGPEQEVAAAGGQARAESMQGLLVRGAGGRAQKAVREATFKKLSLVSAATNLL